MPKVIAQMQSVLMKIKSRTLPQTGQSSFIFFQKIPSPLSELFTNSNYKRWHALLQVKYFVTDCYGGNTLCCNTLTVAIVGSLVSDKCMLLCVLAVNGVETSHQACPNSILPKTTQTFVCAYAQSTWQWCGSCLLMLGDDGLGESGGMSVESGFLLITQPMRLMAAAKPCLQSCNVPQKWWICITI